MKQTKKKQVKNNSKVNEIKVLGIGHYQIEYYIELTDEELKLLGIEDISNLNKLEDYKKYLSLNIKMINYDDSVNKNNYNNGNNNNNKISMTVKIEKKFGRNILLNISVYDSNNKEIKKIFHLKRKINSKL